MQNSITIIIFFNHKTGFDGLTLLAFQFCVINFVFAVYCGEHENLSPLLTSYERLERPMKTVNVARSRLRCRASLLSWEIANILLILKYNIDTKMKHFIPSWMHATIYEHDTWHIHVSKHAMKIKIETLSSSSQQHITFELVRLVSALALVFPTTSNCSTRQWNKGTVNSIIMSILMRSRQCKKKLFA